MCMNYSECKRKRSLGKEKYLKEVTKFKMYIEINKKRLKMKNLATNFFIIPSKLLGQYQIVRMIFCKRRIGGLNFSGYYNRKRVRRWPNIFYPCPI